MILDNDFSFNLYVIPTVLGDIGNTISPDPLVTLLGWLLPILAPDGLITTSTLF